jgi:predicted DNA-binding transcriptional regulator YafY
MAKKRSPGPTAEEKTVTAERAARLYQLLQLLGAGPRTRDVLTKRLGLGVRGFYRDLELLRKVGIAVLLEGRTYTLSESVQAAVGRLPFPDPRLTLAEAGQLAKGRTAAHRKLKEQLGQITKPAGRKRKGR